MLVLVRSGQARAVLTSGAWPDGAEPVRQSALGSFGVTWQR